MRKFFRFARENILGTLTLTLSLTYMFLGLPSQILKIWQTKSVEDISIMMFTLLAVQSFFWILYGVKKKDWFVVTANVFGSLFATMIVVECFLF